MTGASILPPAGFDYRSLPPEISAAVALCTDAALVLGRS